MSFKKFNLSVRRSNTDKQVEILPPLEPNRLPPEQIPIDEKARRVAAAAGSVIGGTMAGFVSGVAKHTITPAAQSVAQGAAKTGKSIASFVRFVFIGAFVLALSVVGLLALILLSAPRR